MAILAGMLGFGFRSEVSPTANWSSVFVFFCHTLYTSDKQPMIFRQASAKSVNLEDRGHLAISTRQSGAPRGSAFQQDLLSRARSGLSVLDPRLPENVVARSRLSVA